MKDMAVPRLLHCQLCRGQPHSHSLQAGFKITHRVWHSVSGAPWPHLRTQAAACSKHMHLMLRQRASSRQTLEEPLWLGKHSKLMRVLVVQHSRLLKNISWQSSAGCSWEATSSPLVAPPCLRPYGGCPPQACLPGCLNGLSGSSHPIRPPLQVLEGTAVLPVLSAPSCRGQNW